MSVERLIAERLVRNRMKKINERSEYYTQPDGSWDRDNSEYHKKPTHPKVGKKVKLLHPESSRQMGRYTIISADDEYVDIQLSPSTTGRYKWEDVKLVESESVPARLGDEVTWRGKKYIIISDEDDQLQLRPSDMVDDDAFDGYGDNSEDIYLDRWQLKEDLTLDDDPEETEQKYSSAATSINSAKLPALFKMVDFKEGSINLDYGGGKFDNVAEYLENTYGATNLVYDKYNRSTEHNREVLNQIRKNGGADTVTCSNVLNVIAEESERLAVLRNCKRYLKSGGTCYITVYEDSGSGEGTETKAGYQLNRKTKDYEDEIKQVFSDVTRRGKLFICR